jgi:hypothetical protein
MPLLTSIISEGGDIMTKIRLEKVPEGLIEETKAIIRLYLFLRHDCGLKYADKLRARDLKELLKAFLED